MDAFRLTFAISLENYADVPFPGSTETNSNLKTAGQWVHQLIFYHWVICDGNGEKCSIFLCWCKIVRIYKDVVFISMQHPQPSTALLNFWSLLLSLIKLDASSVNPYVGHSLFTSLYLYIVYNTKSKGPSEREQLIRNVLSFLPELWCGWFMQNGQGPICW